MFQLTRPAGGEPSGRVMVALTLLVSTHSPRGGRTIEEFDRVFLRFSFNSLAPRGANRIGTSRGVCGTRFQLTRPAGGEPTFTRLSQLNEVSFNSLAPRGANQEHRTPKRSRPGFQLTRPAGGEPELLCCRISLANVSTHSPRGGRTYPIFKAIAEIERFNSLAPRGANLTIRRTRSQLSKFQLTRPAGGEPVFVVQLVRQLVVSTHSPRGGRTMLSKTKTCADPTFQLTRPAGGEPRSPSS